MSINKKRSLTQQPRYLFHDIDTWHFTPWCCSVETLAVLGPPWQMTLYWQSNINRAADWNTPGCRSDSPHTAQSLEHQQNTRMAWAWCVHDGKFIVWAKSLPILDCNYLLVTTLAKVDIDNIKSWKIENLMWLVWLIFGNDILFGFH